MFFVLILCCLWLYNSMHGVHNPKDGVPNPILNPELIE